MSPRSNKLTRIAIALTSVFVALHASSAFAQEPAANPQTLQRLMSAQPGATVKRLSPVREAALKSTARAIGTQTGLIERAEEIAAEVDKRRAKMETLFRFGDLVIGAGVLPPVLVHTENAASVTGDTMRLAGAIYQIKYPARFFSGAPSWRDWLLMGLPSAEEMPEMPKNEQLLPRDADERAFWEQQVRDAYFSGRAQAQEIFENNLSNLEEVYNGMRTFYDLYQRNMVSAPVIGKSQEIVTMDDPNMMVVGDTQFRITMPSSFKADPAKWKALAAKPSVEMPLPVVPGYDRKQVEAAFEEFKRQQQEKKAAQSDAVDDSKSKQTSVTKKADVKESKKTESKQAQSKAASNKTADKGAATAAVIAEPVEEYSNVRVESLRIEIPAAESNAAMSASIASEKAKIGNSGDKVNESKKPAAAPAQPGITGAPLFTVPSQ